VRLLAGLLLLFPITMALAVIDLREHRLPNRLNALAFAIAVVAVEFDANALVCGAAAFAIFLFLHLVTRGGLGLGDVKLAPSLAVVLGHIDTNLALNALLLTFLTAGLLSAILLALRKITVHSRIPFGPFMIMAFWIGVFSH
jgi:leader peptidase (prepilin peptidase) / N-methyltransferase